MAAVAGAVSTISPLIAAAGIAAAVLTLLLASGPHLHSTFFAALIVLLVTYAFLGRGGAYVGVAPIYVGEIVLLLAILVVIRSAGSVRLGVLQWLVIAFAGWGLFRMTPYVGRYGLDALRDSVIWAYAAFALAISFALRGEHFHRVVGIYRRMLPVFIVWVPVAAVFTIMAESAIPKFPGSAVPLLDFKSGDMAVHLAGAAGFLLFGMYSTRPTDVSLNWILLWPVWFVGVAASSALSRAAYLSVSIALIAALILRPSRHWLPFIVIAILLLGIFRLLNPTIDLGTRDLSFNQATKNLRSVTADVGSSELDGTKEWRIKWWGEIYDYTVRGPYFWTGKGFGVNLAEDDGFEVSDDSLRSPHNGHMTVLARMGVPGIALWMLIQATFAGALLRAFFVARASGDVFWMQIDGWLLVYWLAFMTNAAFDVYLEGPQGGIWFWCIFGIGMAAIAAQCRSDRHALPAQTQRLHADPHRP